MTGMFCTAVIIWPQAGQRDRGETQIEAALGKCAGRLTRQFLTLLTPFALHHYRQAIDDHIQKAANEQGDDEYDDQKDDWKFGK